MKSDALNISIKDITKTYGEFFALKDVSLEVKSGEFLTLLGPSGSGKTTLLMVLAGFTRPDYGSVKFGTEEVVLKPPHLRDIGMVFQNYALFPHMNVEQNVGYPQKLRGVSKEKIKETVDEALKTVKLDGLGHRGVAELSGGQRQRVALARAIVFQPKILLMDEPLSALDKKLREEMQIELRQLHDSLNMTTVYVTHDQKEALTMSDRIAVINDGRLMQLDTPSAIYKKPNNAFIADFIGESSLLSVKVSKKNVYLGNTKILVEHSVIKDGDFLLVVRPEKLFLISDNLTDLISDNLTDCNTFTGNVVESIYQGESQLLMIKLDPDSHGDQILRMRIPNGTASLQELPSIGNKITVGLKKSDSFLVE